MSLVPFMLAIEKKGWKDTFFIGYAGGVAFYWSTLYWLNNVTITGFLALTLYLAIYFPLFGLGVRYFRARISVPCWLLAPVFWVALEYVRTYVLTGLPWGLAGATQYRFIPLIQVAAVTGVYGVSFLVVLVNMVVYECIRNRGRGCAMAVAAAVVALSVCISYGVLSLRSVGDSGGSVRVAIVQGNVPQEEKFGEGFKEEIIKRFYRLTLNVSREKPDLIVWPETSVPGYYWYDPLIRSAIARIEERVRTPLLLGSTHIYDARNPKYFNSAFLVGPDGGTVDRYDKIHLVLFGEIIPCERFFPFLKNLVPFEEDFTPGREYTIFPFAQGNFGALICFEDIFPDLSRNFVLRGARFLVNITNDAWFGATSQPYQHAALAVFRCVENSVSMVRATNTGLSCFIDPHGRIVSVLRNRYGQELYVEGTAVYDIELVNSRTFFTRRGNVFAVACLIISAVALGLPWITEVMRKS